MIKIPPVIKLLDLPVRTKPDWIGLEARLVGVLVNVGLWFGSQQAHDFLGNYHTVLSGVLYVPQGREPKVTSSTMMHESLHDWQRKTFWFYRTRYLLFSGFRLHCEASAYGLEVAYYGRKLPNAAAALRGEIYHLGMDYQTARDLIAAYVKRWEAAP